ncbi:UNVERIFIED_CONTAM: putative aquaporin NIP7-1 [Sesamum indicum]
MKAPFQDSSSADISNRASTSSQPKNNRELGYITTSSNGNVARNYHFLKFPNQINTSLVRKLGPLSGFVAGVAISLGVLISGPVSGGSMNPARSLGPALVSWRFDHLWIYVVAPTIGAIAGVLTYRILRLQGWSCKPDPSLRTLQSSQSSLH